MFDFFRTCICNPAEGRQCSWHAGHPLTSSLDELQADLAEAQGALLRYGAAYQKARDEMNRFWRSKNEVAERIDCLRSDIALAQRSRDV